MSNERITDLATGTCKGTDLHVAVDVTDTSMAPTGTDKKYPLSAIKTFIGEPDLTDKLVGYGSASNLLTGDTNFTWDPDNILLSATNFADGGVLLGQNSYMICSDGCDIHGSDSNGIMGSTSAPITTSTRCFISGGDDTTITSSDKISIITSNAINVTGGSFGVIAGAHDCQVTSASNFAIVGGEAIFITNTPASSFSASVGGNDNHISGSSSGQMCSTEGAISANFSGTLFCAQSTITHTYCVTMGNWDNLGGFVSSATGQLGLAYENGVGINIRPTTTGLTVLGAIAIIPTFVEGGSSYDTVPTDTYVMLNGQTAVNLVGIPDGRLLTIKDSSGDATALAPIVVTAPSSEIDGEGTYSIDSAYGFVTIIRVTGATGWRIVAKG